MTVVPDLSGGPPLVSHGAVVVDGLGGRHLDGERDGTGNACSSAGEGEDGLSSVAEHRVGIEPSAEDERLVAEEMGDLGDVGDRRLLDEICERVPRCRPGEPMTRFDLSRSGVCEWLQRCDRGRARRVDLDLGPPSVSEGSDGPLERREVRRGFDSPGRSVVEHRWKCRDAGELDAVDPVDEVGEGDDVVECDTAFVATVEAITGGDDAYQHALRPVQRAIGCGGFASLVLAEHRPEAWLQRCCSWSG